MLRLLPIFLIVFTLAACKKSHSDRLRDAMERDVSISVNGTERTYDVYAPDGQQNSPLIILLHGHGGDADQEQNGGQYGHGTEERAVHFHESQML